MKAFAHPVGEDHAVVSGESGAMGLDGNSRVLLFSTEGNTDPEYYEEIVSLHK